MANTHLSVEFLSNWYVALVSNIVTIRTVPYHLLKSLLLQLKFDALIIPMKLIYPWTNMAAIHIKTNFTSKPKTSLSMPLLELGFLDGILSLEGLSDCNIGIWVISIEYWSHRLDIHILFKRHSEIDFVGTISGLILDLRPANERRRYKVTPSLIGWVQT